MKAKKSWREKLANSKGLPKVGEVSGKMSKRWGAGRMVIPAPIEVDALMKQVPKGKVVTINEVRAALATRHKADFACPLTTGIFAWIAAHAADEAARAGSRRITPYWRTLKNSGELNAKYPGGVKEVARRLRAEGHTIRQKGKRAVVADFERSVFSRLR
jgi:alkylated DNA nucleotide flippase Atl1